ncbi:type II secretion system minor pseudopilin GspI [Polynucleobacter sp. 15G-AUS-farblos]|uniref:type II secretion system minor pseudopilin GspI n=1 Tax=Polynucleobacter sp. 15G-AUS-farblos TaxID=2689094 RepID=UPI001C0D9AEF|nr:type II secretion system minor pseudopilin GspI [Polynucleobacter sp. 15G-AUS-farblos]MBU3583243.1 type II secretion system minor pseudopilin GspI [Polynucleobacter sp. 15G-AUS-farblos]
MNKQKFKAKNGFALIEVLVGLVVLSIALIAAFRAVALSTDTQFAVTQRTMALWSADNALNEIRMNRVWPEIGTSTFSCPQATLILVCQRKVSAMPNPSFRRVEVTVFLANEANSTQVNGSRLAWLVTVVPNLNSGAL